MYRSLKKYTYITFLVMILSLEGGVIFAQNILNTEFVQGVGPSEVTFEMVKIPGGVYQMGSPDGDSDETLPHAVQIDSLWVGRYEVTWELFELFLAENNNLFDSLPEEKLKKIDAITRPSPPFEDPSFGMGKKGYPVVSISPYAVLTFCKWLSTVTGKFYRLPTEAEWEYICKAGGANNNFFADKTNLIDEYGWSYENSNGHYAKVGEKLPNTFGLFDILGNVAEWTLDEYDENFYKKQQDTIAVNPWNAPRKLHPRVFRGGSWDDDAQDLSCTLRSKSGFYLQKNDPQIPKSFWWYTDSSFIGFRLVHPAKQPTEAEIKKFWQIVLDE